MGLTSALREVISILPSPVALVEIAPSSGSSCFNKMWDYVSFALNRDGLELCAQSLKMNLEYHFS